ncbi:TetR/AcrR family transcriptional regulator [Mesobacillus selenatarsenatis]|uniref:TetR/AcrR family transcriptional regulator n=1 Tax=Mesobacillus selenatarsenatis TaxID=388741 RepID=A0A846TF05_9BACI|nr:TetR/AcrR family transcriptional regulator [Mesobacillus selenatarsenatis]NKE04007.1 TetR/AcrR family transcriptional regulator [Mesobacillus selenatarsenatis]
MNTKDKLLKKGLEHFSEKGYEGTSLIEIAKDVGIRKSTIYSHFSNKDELFFEVLHRVNQEFLEFCTNCLENEKDLSIDEKLYILLVESIKVNKEKYQNALFWKRLRLFPPVHLKESLEKRLQVQMSPLLDMIERLFAEAMQSGEVVKSDHNSIELAMAYYTLMDGLVISILYDREQNLENRIEILWSAFKDSLFRR